jgi:hypothetical protein
MDDVVWPGFYFVVVVYSYLLKTSEVQKTVLDTTILV